MVRVVEKRKSNTYPNVRDSGEKSLIEIFPLLRVDAQFSSCFNIVQRVDFCSLLLDRSLISTNIFLRTRWDIRMINWKEAHKRWDTRDRSSFVADSYLRSNRDHVILSSRLELLNRRASLRIPRLVLNNSMWSSPEIIDELLILIHQHDRTRWSWVSSRSNDPCFTLLHLPSSLLCKDSGHPSNETNFYALVEELRLIDNNLQTLGQLLQQRLTRLLKTGLPTSNDDLLLLYHEHKVRSCLICSNRKQLSSPSPQTSSKEVSRSISIYFLALRTTLVQRDNLSSFIIEIESAVAIAQTASRSGLITVFKEKREIVFPSAPDYLWTADVVENRQSKGDRGKTVFVWQSARSKEEYR